MVRLSGDLDPCYRRLAKQLDAIPNGFPSTDSEAELLLLAKLYTPAQAEMAALLSLQPESAREVAKRVGMSRSDVEEQLQVMARTGLIQAHRQQESLRYSLMPFIVGIYEAQLARMDEELARLAEAYFVEGFGTKALSIQPSFHRVIPVEQTIPLHIDVFPYERASELLRGARSFGVRSCICRVEKRQLGQGCDHPVENCIVVHSAEAAFGRSRTIRTVTDQEAMRILREADDDGLVHSSANVQTGLGYICNCCTCCCLMLRGIAEFGSPDALSRAGFCAIVDDSLCLGCGSCLEGCPFGALSLTEGGGVEVLEGRCLGCGLCVAACPQQALQLARSPGEAVPPPPIDQEAWMGERARNREGHLGESL